MLSGLELKIKRVMLNIKGIDVAEHLHIHKSYVSKMEREVQPIPEQMYEKWIEYLGIKK